MKHLPNPGILLFAATNIGKTTSDLDLVRFSRYDPLIAYPNREEMLNAINENRLALLDAVYGHRFGIFKELNQAVEERKEITQPVIEESSVIVPFALNFAAEKLPEGYRTNNRKICRLASTEGAIPLTPYELLVYALCHPDEDVISLHYSKPENITVERKNGRFIAEILFRIPTYSRGRLGHIMLSGLIAVEQAALDAYYGAEGFPDELARKAFENIGWDAQGGKERLIQTKFIFRVPKP